MTKGILLPDLHPDTDALPAGRYSVSADDIADKFGATSERRRKLWGDWETATALLREHVPVCAAWIGGSFLTGKVNPGDIDCVYLVEAAAIESATGDAAGILGAFAAGHAVSQHLGLELDTFIVEWMPSSTPSRAHPRVRRYHDERGYWDDLWSKMRSGSKSATPVKLDAHPRRGYVEVILDGYSEGGSFCIN